MGWFVEAAAATSTLLMNYLVLGGVIVGGGLGGLGLVALIVYAFTEQGKYRLWRWFPAAWLFTRIAKSRFLDHPVRDAVHEFLGQRPGSSMSDIHDAIDVPRSTLVHHLRVLEQQGLVRSRKDGYRRRFHQAGPPPPPGPYLTEAQRKLVDTVAANPGITQGRLADRVSMTRTTVLYHVRRLNEMGQLRVEKDGRALRHYAAGGSR